MSNGYLTIKQSPSLHGTVELTGAKNAVLVIIASLILTDDISTLENVPNNADVQQMIILLSQLGAQISFDIENKKLTVDTSTISTYEVNPEIMNKMRASILVMGPLLARFGKAKVALPGGCLLGTRPIDYHLNGFKKFGISIEEHNQFFTAKTSPSSEKPSYTHIVFEYPSVGATENLMMFATLAQGTTVIVNAALEPEVLDLINVLKKMGASIQIQPGAVLVITGTSKLKPITHSIIPDRLEAGALLLATAITGGNITLPNARPDHMDIFLEKLKEMGHDVIVNYPTTPQTALLQPPSGITLKATTTPQAISFRTGPYPEFPTDLQAPTMASLCLANGTSIVEETVFENRMIHVKELQKMGAQITTEGSKATIRGVEELYGCRVIASDIRASCALVLAGLVALGQTKVTGLGHWKRGYDKLEEKINKLGGNIQVREHTETIKPNEQDIQPTTRTTL